MPKKGEFQMIKIKSKNGCEMPFYPFAKKINLFISVGKIPAEYAKIELKKIFPHGRIFIQGEKVWNNSYHDPWYYDVCSPEQVIIALDSSKYLGKRLARIKKALKVANVTFRACIYEGIKGELQRKRIWSKEGD